MPNFAPEDPLSDESAQSQPIHPQVLFETGIETAVDRARPDARVVVR